ncbi:EAL domain-containing protein [Planktothrix paucivesiculata]|nr:EAL domain-containing protein [Planktothrix paucivesiculata]
MSFTMLDEMINLQNSIIPPCAIVTPDTPLLEALILMNQTNAKQCLIPESPHLAENLTSYSQPPGCLLVMEDEELVGILTERDTVKLAVQAENLSEITVKQIMTKPVITLNREEFTDVFVVHNMMRRFQIRHLPILNEQKQVLGLVTLSSLRQVLNHHHFLRFRQVSEVMTRQVMTVYPLTPIREIAKILAQYNISCIVVTVEQEGRSYPVGIVTERDILQLQALELNLQNLTAETVMSYPIFSIKSTESLSTAQQILQTNKIRRLVVINEQGELQGIITESNLVQVLDPLEIYGILEILERKVNQLEESRILLLKKKDFELAKAIENQEFSLYYQPQIDLKSGEIVGAEALIRWISPENGNISPTEFIPIAENTGLIVPLGKWVLKTACTQAIAWKQVGLPPLEIAVNISAQQLEDENFVSDVISTLTETGLEPQRLKLELTESVLVRNIHLTLEKFKELQELGIEIAIDDFGTGYASLSYIQNFLFDILKIDRCFIKDIMQNNKNSAIVSAIIRLARQLNFKVIAEGVETELEREFLTQQGCDFIQGYLISPPLPFDQFCDFYFRYSEKIKKN